jgi:hypothetical protein
MKSVTTLPWSQKPPRETVLNHRNPVPTFTTGFFAIRFNIILLRFQTETLYAFLVSTAPVTCRAHPGAQYFIALTLFDKGHSYTTLRYFIPRLRQFSRSVYERGTNGQLFVFQCYLNIANDRTGFILFAHCCISRRVRNLMTMTMTNEHSLPTKLNHLGFFRRPDDLNSRSLSWRADEQSN